MNNKTKRKLEVGALITGIILVMAMLYFVGSGKILFTTDEQNPVQIQTQISDCKFVMDTNVCEKYSECTYDSVNDRSCIKGYEIITQELPEPQIVPMNVLVGGGSQ